MIKPFRVPSIDAVLDIECSEWDKFVMGGIRTRSGTKIFEGRMGDEALYRAVLNCSGNVWAHNGGRYDYLWFLDRARRDGIKCNVFQAGSSITSIRIGKNLFLRDSARIFVMTLEMLSQWDGDVNAVKSKLPANIFPCVCGDDCGGYCSIPNKPNGYQLKALREYLERDIHALWQSLHSAFSFAESAGIRVCGTIGATAWATAQHELSLPKSRLSPSRYARIRAGYFGGRTQVGQVQADRGHRYDINSAYPAALSRINLPVGASTIVSGQAAHTAYLSGKEGIYHATVRVRSDAYAPPLPVRAGQRIAYPVGLFTASWTGLELRHAEQLDCSVDVIHSGTVWNESAPIIKPFVDRIWGLRRTAIIEGGKKHPRATWLKWVANSLTGKFAQNPLTWKTALGASMDDAIACPGKGKCSRRCSGHCGAWIPMDGGAGYAFRKPEYKMAECAHIQWSAYLTAAARIQLLGKIREAGESWVYCDTDSVYSTEECPTDIGDELGEWQYEGEFRDWEAIGPKAYRYQDPKKDKPTVKMKGISDADSEDFDNFRIGKKIISTRGVKTFKTALRGESLFQRKSLSRSNRAAIDRPGWVGDRRLDSDGRSWPVTLAELADSGKRQLRLF